MGYDATLKGNELPVALLDPEDEGTTWQVFTS
jgi:hypothetical protein